MLKPKKSTIYDLIAAEPSLARKLEIAWDGRPIAGQPYLGFADMLIEYWHKGENVRGDEDYNALLRIYFKAGMDNPKAFEILAKTVRAFKEGKRIAPAWRPTMLAWFILNAEKDGISVKRFCREHRRKCQSPEVFERTVRRMRRRLGLPARG